MNARDIDIREMNETFGVIVLTSIGLLCFVWIIVRLARSRKARTVGELVEAPIVRRCLCNEVATHAAPHLRVTRGWFDRLYGLPPRYVATVDAMRAPTLCAVHQLLAMALAEKWAVGIRSRYADLAAAIAEEAASFEVEGLEKSMRGSITRKTIRPLAQASPNVINGGPS